MRKLQISIGITAYNEEKNIKNIITSLLKQNRKYFVLKEVILITDGCTDNTYSIVSKIKSRKLKVKKGTERIGQTLRQNQIIRSFKGDILVFVEADTLPESNDTLDNLIRKFYISDSLQVAVGGDLREFGKNIQERIQKSGANYKKSVFQKWNNGQNIYWLGGHSIKAMRRKFAKSIHFPNDVPEDTYIYLHAKKRGARMERFPEVNMQTGIIRNFSDWVRQSKKFITGKNSLSKYFGKDTVKSEYTIPFSVYLNCYIQRLKTDPVWTSFYLLFLLVNRLFSYNKNALNPKYEIYQSTKEVLKDNRPSLIISSYDDTQNPYYGGGGAIAVHEVAKRLTKHYQVKVITGSYPGAKNRIVDGVSYRRIGINSMGPYIGQASYSVFLPLKLLFEKFDVWMESFTPPFSVGFTSLFTNKPVIALVHMLSSKDMLRKYKLPFWVVEKFGLKFYKNFIVTSESSRKEIAKINPKANFFVIPNGVDLPKKIDKKGYHILYIGRIEMKQKGLDLLLKAQKIAYPKTKTKLLIAGGGNSAEVNKLKKTITHENLSKSVKYLGKIKGRKKEKAFQKSKAIMLPSRFDTYPLVALESMSYAKPLVIFDIKSLMWIPNNTCLRAKPFDTQDLAGKMINLIKNEKSQAKLGKNARIFAQKHSWEKTSEKYLLALESSTNTEYDKSLAKNALFNF